MYSWWKMNNSMEMNINIITYSCAVNYGAVLQTYGLYKYLSNNYDVQVIDYISERYNYESPEYVYSTGKWKTNALLRTIWKKTKLRKLIKNRKKFREFVINNMKMTDSYYSCEQLEKEMCNSDIFITGSDQVWNSEYTYKNMVDKPYYLCFLRDDAIRLSYASSFGRSSIEEDEAREVSKYLSKYKAISVREESAKRIIQSMGLDSTVVADPTILCDVKAYYELMKDVDIERGYILLFLIGFDKNLYKMLRRVAKINHKRLLVVVPSLFDNPSVFQDKVVLPRVEEWLKYIESADYVVTNSFHASVFSILFNKQFSSYLKVANNGRIEDLLLHTGLVNRGMTEVNFDVLMTQYKSFIDYSPVNCKVDEWRLYSRKWLDEQLASVSLT